ncbi:hypothetical protein [Streptomyces sp. NPDC048825]|uniref:hypothetical protein n=1 Tax=Streptomyces sp. NPDC048825 TaxID=3365592 RepID=UPI003714D3B6
MDAMRGQQTRRDLLLQITELHRAIGTRPDDGQLALDCDVAAAEPGGLPEMTAREALGAELNVLQIDVSRHLMEHHHRALREISATDAAHRCTRANRFSSPAFGPPPRPRPWHRVDA